MAPIKSVAVIGAGISGVSAAAHLLRHGLDVVVFERSDVAGGVWHFDERTDNEPPYPAADGEPSPATPTPASPGQKPSDWDQVALDHAPPGPCYEGLTSNVPTSMMRTTLLKWPAGTPEHVTHREVEAYVHQLARETGAHDVTLYNTSVEEAIKHPGADKWTVRTKTLVKHAPRDDGSSGNYTFTHKSWAFDAVVVASGHYHVPLVPKIPGLAAWKRRFPSRVMHSKLYRKPEPFAGQNVLLIGASVSSLDICRELADLGGRTYQSSRGGRFDLAAAMLPPNSERVPSVVEFRLDEGKHLLDNDDVEGAPVIPGTVHLADGRILGDVHRVIVATGYQTTYPFLKAAGLEDASVPVDGADERIIITEDQCVTHNLHKDVFYMPDPSLAFIGVPYYTSTFSMFDFQAEVVARVWAGLAELPAEAAMRAEYQARKAKGEQGKAFHSLLHGHVEYMKEILEWVNKGVEERGLERMKGVDDDWYKAVEDFRAKSQRLGPPEADETPQPVASKYYAALVQGERESLALGS